MFNYRLHFWPKSCNLDLILFSQFGLFLFFLIWTLLAANLIYHFEHKINNCDELVSSTAKKLFYNIRSNYFRDWLLIIQSDLTAFEEILVNNFLNGVSSNGEIWNRSGCFLFTVMISTSLAFGCPVPSSKSGQVITLIYAFIGI